MAVTEGAGGVAREAAVPAVLGGSPAFPEGLPLTRVRVPDRDELARRFDAILDSGQLTDGGTVRALEEAAAAMLDVPHVVAVSSCTSGLMLALQALGVAGRRVVMPSFTFSATAHAAHWAGGEPVFAEIAPDTLTLDPAAATAAAGPGTGALMATHVYGTPCDVEGLRAVADARGVPLLYDAAHAFGSRRGGVPVGGFGAAEVFSLSPTKVVVAAEGGLVATRDAALAERIRLGRGYGNPGDYDCLFPGLNARMSELHAALALVSLRTLPQRVAHRGALAAAFAARIAGLPGVRLPALAKGDTSTWKDLTLIVDPTAFGCDVPRLAEALRAEGIDSRRYFHPAVHTQKAYARTGEPVRLPVTEEMAERVLTVPLWSHMDEPTILRVADAVARIQEHATKL
ncbi:DegT/DnrJ/EryC1/StrS family aminotransferase [Yinghuangia sp. ASG 101]|uniref:DegT/DnrJ/EryC1/StrS family aminotransferase n=1 Tax=Yinghuangia sp. ASG 101 TaxID=2896848 RepID=UPI001E51C427|nr:DegT/DnrJ/EryC1/StrS family aminotransferase [Yinghuangia sp. ASG 101]UGQ10567.1 DegT/DnrJ/EryC1/StrS family aminotransferase [Yinghuangia sp. ASG 101]